MAVSNKTIKDENRFYFYSLCLIFLYYVGSAMAGAELSLRYQIILIPLFCLFSASFWVNLFKRHFHADVMAGLAVLILETAHVAPFYISYQNPTVLSSFLHPGVHWGQGGYEVAQCANGLGQAEELVVFADYEGFSEFFKGRGYRYLYRRKIDENYIQSYDYLCLTLQRYLRS